MKDTNAIEKALKARINKECRVLVDDFVAELEKLSTNMVDLCSMTFKKNGAPDSKKSMFKELTE